MCDIGYIVQDHIPALMQLVTNDLPQYNMQLITTKCLNTAVMFMYLFLGQKALQYTRYCEVPTVQKRYREHGNFSLATVQAFEKDALAAVTADKAERTLYYVMLTDSPLVNPKTNDQGYFPGHVFVIEKIPPPREASTTATNAASAKKTIQPRFNLYQSYIDQYDLKGHVVKNRSLAYSYTRMKALLADLKHIFSVDVWDAACTAAWKRLAFVDAAKWEGMQFKDRVFFCHSSVKTGMCLSRLRTYLQEKYDELMQTWDTHNPASEYCPAKCTKRGGYHANKRNSATPLTREAMRAELEAMLGKI